MRDFLKLRGYEFEEVVNWSEIIKDIKNND